MNYFRLTQVLASIAILTLAIVHIAYPGLTIDSTVVALLILLVGVWFFPYVKRIEVPGGAIEFQEHLAAAAKALARQKPTPSEAEPRKRGYPQKDPRYALVAVRGRIEGQLRQLAELYSMFVAKRTTFMSIVTSLRSRGAIDETLAEGLLDLGAMSNLAAQGAPVDEATGWEAVNISEQLSQALDEKTSLSRKMRGVRKQDSE